MRKSSYLPYILILFAVLGCEKSDTPDAPGTPGSSSHKPKKAVADYKGDLGSCKEIKEAYTSKNGAYFLTVNGKKFKTYCDMDGGGLTLVWSYSEKTNLNTYKIVGKMGQTDLQTYKDAPQSFDESKAGVIKYDNFRLPSGIMWSLIGDEFKIHVTTDPKDPNNDLAKDNYMLVEGEDHIKFLFSEEAVTTIKDESGPKDNFKLLTIPASGKIMGHNFKIDGDSTVATAAEAGTYMLGKTGTMEGQPIRKTYLEQYTDDGLHLLLDGEYNKNKLPSDLKVGESEEFFGGFSGSGKTDLFGQCTSSDKRKEGGCLQATDLKPHSKLRYIQWWLK